MNNKKTVTRRDFVKGAGAAAVGLAVGWPALADDESVPLIDKSRVVLIRHEDAVGTDRKVNGEVLRQMLDEAVVALCERDTPQDCFAEIVSPDDIVGIKSNEWGPLPTPPELERALRDRVKEVGVPEKKIAVDDRGVLHDETFLNATALINVRPMRTHAWSGVGSLIKNYIMFVEYPPDYHDDACASLGAIWHLPIVANKTRLNIQVLLTPLFYGVGPHHFDQDYLWAYKGLAVGFDPVAVDTVALRILQLKRREHFGEERTMKPSAHHIAHADTEYGLGHSDFDHIELVKLGWKEGALI